MQSINLYSKEQTDSLLSDKADSDNVYSQSEINTMLTDYYTKSETYSKSELDNEFSDIDDVLNTMYTQNEIDGLLLSKANVSDVYAKTETYSKTEIDTLLSSKADSSDLNNYYTKSETYSKTEIDTLLSSKADSSDLNNYYTKSETYSKTETDTLIQSLPVYSGVIKINVPHTLTWSTASATMQINISNFQFNQDDLLIIGCNIASNSETEYGKQMFETLYVDNKIMYKVNVINYTGSEIKDFLAYSSSGGNITSIAITRRVNGNLENLTNAKVYCFYVLRKATT